ncbi:hypothetical protein GGI43DRAFT_137145 [Trichoderma evansii]
MAMKTTQDLIQGVPQDVTNSSVILGLMSWHIYPDLNVFSPNQYVAFNDPLVKPGGVITLGLEAKEKNCSGVSWSVSLSHLRFYGDPVVIEKLLEEDSDRITVEELRYIIFGCVLGGWAQPALISIEEAAECFSALGDAIGSYNSATDEKGYNTPLGWITPLIDTAKDFLSVVEKERDATLYFIEFGRRRGRNFLDDEFRDIVPMFGLLNPYLLFKCSPDFYAPSRDMEGSIAILRRLAQDIHLRSKDCIIITKPRVGHGSGDMAERDIDYEGNWEFASAVPIARQTRKRTSGGEPRDTQRHARWVHINRTKDPLSQRYIDISNETTSKATGKTADKTADEIPSSFSGQDWDSGELHWEMLDETAMAVKICDCAERGNGSCRYLCPCLEQGVRCTSMCSCLSGFAGMERTLRCTNARSCQSASGIPDEDCHWLSVRSTLYIDSTILTSCGTEFQWMDAPGEYTQTNAVSSPGRHITDEEYRQFINLPDDKLEYQDDSPYLENGRAVLFRSVEANGVASLLLRNATKIKHTLLYASRVSRNSALQSPGSQPLEDIS